MVVGGGLGAQAFLAQTAYEFLPEHLIIPFMEASLRVLTDMEKESEGIKLE